MGSARWQVLALVASAVLALGGCQSADVEVVPGTAKRYAPQGPARFFEGPAPPECTELARLEVRESPFRRSTEADLRERLARAAGQLGADRVRVESYGTERRTGFLFVAASRYDARRVIGTAWRCPRG